MNRVALAAILRECLTAFGLLVCSTLLTFVVLEGLRAGTSALDWEVVPNYMRWLWRFLFERGFGRTYTINRDVAEVVSVALGRTTALALGGMLIGSVASFPLGIAAALRSDSRTMRAISLLVVLVSAVPVFLLALSVLSPTIRMFGGLADVPLWRTAGLYLVATTILALGDGAWGEMTKLSQESTTAALREPYVRAVLARGGKVHAHIARALAVPLTTIVSSRFTSLLGGAVVVEYLFFSNGIGMMVLAALRHRENDIVMGVVSAFSAIIIGVHLLNRILIVTADPRIHARD